MGTLKSAIVVLALAPLLAASAFAQSIPTMKAEASRVARPPPTIEPGVKGYGIHAVEGATLDEMKARCSTAAAARSAVEAARCEQLRRTMKTQPGNTAQ